MKKRIQQPLRTLFLFSLIFFFKNNLSAQWNPNWYPGGAGFNTMANADALFPDPAPWAQGGNQVSSLSNYGGFNNYACGTSDGSPFALMAGGAELINLDVQQRVAIGWNHVPSVNDCVLDIKGSGSEFRIYGDNQGHFEATKDFRLYYGGSAGSFNEVYEIYHGIPNNSGSVPRFTINQQGHITHYGNSYTEGRLVVGPPGFGGYLANSRMSLDGRTIDGLHIEASNGKAALAIVNGAGASRFKVWINNGGGEDTKIHMSGAAQLGFVTSVGMLDNNTRLNLDAHNMNGLKVTTNNAGNKMLYVHNLNSANDVFEVKGDGTTHIGNWRPNPNGPCAAARLTVDGQILAREVRVAISRGNTANDRWADYVFEKDYKLMPLKEVEKYVTKNHHLPDVPSEAEVLKNGVDMTQMNIALLKKIEELYLYVIELEKKIK